MEKDKELLTELLKKYIDIFLMEYSNYLDDNQLSFLKNINYNKVIEFVKMDNPIGEVSLGTIYLSKSANELIGALEQMPNYNTKHYYTINHSYTSYLKYICENGYSIYQYYADHLMYFVFLLVTKNNTGIINGLISNEVLYLSHKYHFQIANLYCHEQFITERFNRLLPLEVVRKILFLDNTTAFRYLSECYGYRYAKLFYEVNNLINSEIDKIDNGTYSGFNGFLQYVRNYDSIQYVNAYDYLLDFQAENMHI